MHLQNKENVARAVKAELTKAMSGFGYEVIQVLPRCSTISTAAAEFNRPVDKLYQQTAGLRCGHDHRGVVFAVVMST